MAGNIMMVMGIPLFFVEAGAGLPIVYVHGNTGSSRWFEKVMEVPGFRTIAVDMPNFGNSAPLDGPITIERYAEYVAAFMEALQLKNAVVVGHSLGGCVVQALAVHHSELVRALVLIDSGAPTGLLTPQERYPIIELMRTNREILEKALQAVVPTLQDPDFFRLLVDDAQKMTAPAWIGNAEALSHFDIQAKCSAYTGPVLVIRGELDPIITAEMASATANSYPKAKLVSLPAIGHSVIVENPNLFVTLLKNFLAELNIQ